MITNKLAYVYDVELINNYFLIGIMPLDLSDDIIKEYIESDINNDKENMKLLRDKMVIFIEIKSNTTVNLEPFKVWIKSVKCLVGFNNSGYDDILLDYLTICKETDSNIILSKLNDMSRRIINSSDWNKRSMFNELRGYKSTYLSLDIFKIMRFDATKTSLKQLGIQLKWYKTQSLPYSNMNINNEQIDELKEYNINDLLISLTAYHNPTIKEEIKSRLDMGKEYGVFLGHHSRSSAANIVLLKLYTDATGLYKNKVNSLRTYRRIIPFRDIISDIVKFKDKDLNNLLHTFKNTIFKVGVDNFKYEVKYKNTIYTLGLGGIHSKDQPGEFITNDKYTYVDVDFDSWYPMLIINHQICPAHLNKDKFISLFKDLVDKRLYAKHNKDNTLSGILKIIINSIYGKFKDEFSWLYDILATYQTTLNGQLLLLMQAELNENNGFQVISANTDGLLFKVPTNRLQEHRDLNDNFAKSINHKIEINYYHYYVRTSVNDYAAVLYNGKIKRKGSFSEEIELGKGYDKPIISKVINKYFIEGKPIDDILYNHKDIYDFCMSQKIGHQFVNIYKKLEGDKIVDIELPKNIRYFCSNKGGTIVKKYKDENKFVNILAGQYVTLFNQFYKVPNMKDYDINYRYYKKEISKIVYQILHLDDKSGISGNMFDELEDY